MPANSNAATARSVIARPLGVSSSAKRREPSASAATLPYNFSSDIVFTAGKSIARRFQVSP